MAHVPKQARLGQSIWHCVLSYQEVCFSIAALASYCKGCTVPELESDCCAVRAGQNVMLLVKSDSVNLRTGCMLRKETVHTSKSSA